MIFMRMTTQTASYMSATPSRQPNLDFHFFFELIVVKLCKVMHDKNVLPFGKKNYVVKTILTYLSF